MNFHLTCSYDKINKIWKSGTAKPNYNLEDSMGKILFDRLKKCPDNILQIDDIYNTTNTNSEILTWAIRIAQQLKQMQLKQNDIIGISAKNSTYLLPVVLGCFFNCNTFHAVNPMLDEATISHCFGITKPKIIFCDGEDYHKINMATMSYRPSIFTISEHLEEVPTILNLLLATTSEELYEPEKLIQGSNQTIAILCSSGTSGKPKAVTLSTLALLHANRLLNSETNFFSASTTDWYTGLWYLINNCLSGFTRIITKKPFDPEYFIELVRKYKISYAFLSSHYVALLVQHPLAKRENLSTLYGLQISGSPLSEAILKRFMALFNDNVSINFGYGITEIGAIAFNFDKTKAKSVGNLMPNLSLRVVDDDGKNLSANQVGEIYVYNPIHWNGYYDNPIETEAVKDSKGWFHTGDLGYMDEENFLYLVNRKKEVLKYQGNHYWPNEIENVIAELPDVMDVCVVAVFDDSRGDVAGALVVKAENSSLTEQDIIDYVKKRLIVPQKQINSGVYFIEQLPYNLNNKCLRNVAKTILQSLVDSRVKNN